MSDDSNHPPDGFRLVPDFPRYAVNQNGIVLSVCNGNGGKVSWSLARQLTPEVHTCGYLRVSLRERNNTRRAFVHSLVLESFIGPRPEGMECRHLDGNPANNHISNLEWGSRLDNILDMRKHGTSNQGERHYCTKLTSEDILAIRSRAASGERQCDISNDFPVSAQTIWDIITRKSWKHI